MQSSVKWLGAALLLAASMTGTTAGPASDNLFPAAKDTVWTYAGTAGSTPLNLTAKVTSSTTSAGKTTVVVQWLSNNQPMQDETYIVSATEVSRAKSGAYGNNVLTPPIPVIKYPMSVGKSWEWSGMMAMNGGQLKVPASAKLKVAAQEKVKVGSESLNCYKVDMSVTVTAQGQATTIPASYWFAPGVGLVKQSSTLPTPDGKGVVIEATATKYTIK